MIHVPECSQDGDEAVVAQLLQFADRCVTGLIVGLVDDAVQQFVGQLREDLSEFAAAHPIRGRFSVDVPLPSAEPTASLDPAAARRVEQLILQIREAGTATILTTHDLGLARRIAEEVVFLYRGRVLEHAAASAFFEAPVTREARAFLQGDLTW